MNKRNNETKDTRRFPFSSEECMILCINNFPFPEGYDLKYHIKKNENINEVK